MDFDSKEKVLVAVFIEYQKDIFDFKKNVTSKVLGLDEEVFATAIEKLEGEDLIYRANDNIELVKRSGGGQKVQYTNLDNAKISTIGIDYVQEKLNIDRTLSGKEKIEALINACKVCNCSEIQDISNKTLAEITHK